MVLVDSSRRRRSSSRSRGGSSGSSNHIDDPLAGNAVVTMIIIMIIAKITITAKSIMLKIIISHNDIDYHERPYPIMMSSSVMASIFLIIMIILVYD